MLLRRSGEVSEKPYNVMGVIGDDAVGVEDEELLVLLRMRSSLEIGLSLRMYEQKRFMLLALKNLWAPSVLLVDLMASPKWRMRRESPLMPRPKKPQ